MGLCGYQLCARRSHVHDSGLTGGPETMSPSLPTAPKALGRHTTVHAANASESEMNPRTPLLITLASAVAVAAFAVNQAEAHAGVRCGKLGRIFLANASVRVLRVSFAQSSLRRPPGYYACRRGSRRLYEIGGFDRDLGGVRRIRLAGRYVAFEDRPCGPGGCGEATIRLNVATGQRRVLSEKAPNDTLPALDLELTRGGTVVWIRALVNPAGERFEVVRWDGAAASVLDSGPLDDIQAESLAISAGRAYWFAHGQAMSAIVDPAESAS
jgi:hypothetical protein